MGMVIAACLRLCTKNAEEPTSRKRFLREARLASSLDHPNICTIHEVGEAEGRLFIAMQFVEGDTLRGVIDGHPLNLESMLSISLQVAEALQAAHVRGIVHRDVKTGNIIISPQGQASVLDFGIAKLLEQPEGGADTHMTRTGAVLGTPSSMSPEQARGEHVDHRSDIFSFGVVLYEMATGRAPFKGKSHADVIGALLRDAHSPASELNREMPERLSAVIDRALAKEPAARYQSMQELIADLRQVVAEAGGLDHLFNSSGNARSVVPLVPLRKRSLLKPFGSGISRRAALASLAAIAGLILALYYLWPMQQQPADAKPTDSIRSIAVLPFKPLVADDRDESLEMGMADTLIAKLSNIKQINVRPISAVRKYAGLEQDAAAAGREQKADAVLDGQIQKSGEKIRVTVRLVRVRDGTVLWTSQFDEKVKDIFRVQDSISERVAGLLAVKLSGDEQQQLTKRYTHSTEAYQLYLMGRYHLNRLTDDGIYKSLEYFQQAIEKDSTFALAHVGVAESYNSLGGFNVLRPKEVYPKARSAAETALKLDDMLAQAHTALAIVKYAHEWDWSGAEKEFKRALEINLTDSDTHYQYGYYLALMGRFDEATAELRRGQELDPVSLVKITGLAQVLFFARRYDEAIEQCRTALDMDPNLGFAHWLMGLAYVQKGMYEPAIQALQKSITLSGDSPDEPATLARAYALSGKTSEAWKILRELEHLAKNRYISPAALADVYGTLGETNRAFALLDKAYDDRDNMIVLLKVEPIFDPLRSDPRYQDILRRVGFPQQGN